MEPSKHTPDPLPPEVREERAGRRRMWALFLIAMAILAVIVLAGTMLLRTEPPEAPGSGIAPPR